MSFDYTDPMDIVVPPLGDTDPMDTGDVDPIELDDTNLVGMGGATSTILGSPEMMVRDIEMMLAGTPLPFAPVSRPLVPVPAPVGGLHAGTRSRMPYGGPKVVRAQPIQVLPREAQLPGYDHCIPSFSPQTQQVEFSSISPRLPLALYSKAPEGSYKQPAQKRTRQSASTSHKPRSISGPRIAFPVVVGRTLGQTRAVKQVRAVKQEKTQAKVREFKEKYRREMLKADTEEKIKKVRAESLESLIKLFKKADPTVLMIFRILNAQQTEKKWHEEYKKSSTT